MKRHAASSFGSATALAPLLIPVSASAQELEPGASGPFLAGLNIATVVNSFNWGDSCILDPAAPIDEASARINTTALSFTRGVQPGGTTANAGAILPIVGGQRRGRISGNPLRSAGSDRAIRDSMAMNLWGAGDDAKEFARSNTNHRRYQPHRARRCSGNTIRRS